MSARTETVSGYHDRQGGSDDGVLQAINWYGAIALGEVRGAGAWAIRWRIGRPWARESRARPRRAMIVRRGPAGAERPVPRPTGRGTPRETESTVRSEGDTPELQSTMRHS